MARSCLLATFEPSEELRAALAMLAEQLFSLRF